MRVEARTAAAKLTTELGEERAKAKAASDSFSALETELRSELKQAKWETSRAEEKQQNAEQSVWKLQTAVKESEEAREKASRDARENLQAATELRNRQSANRDAVDAAVSAKEFAEAVSANLRKDLKAAQMRVCELEAEAALKVRFEFEFVAHVCAPTWISISRIQYSARAASKYWHAPFESTSSLTGAGARHLNTMHERAI